MSPVVKVIAASLIWAGSWLAGRIVAQFSLPPLHAASWRFFFGALGLSVLLLVRREPWPRGRAWLWMAAMALTGIVLYNVCFFYGLRFIPAGRASLIVATNPSMLLLFSALLGERLTGRRMLAVAVAFSGAFLALTQGQFAAFFSGGLGFGDLVIGGCVLGWSLYTMAGRPAIALSTPVAATSYSTLLGTLIIWLLDAALSPPTPAGDWPLKLWLALAFLGVMGTSLAFLWYMDAVYALGPARAGAYLNLVPVFAVVMSAVFQGEPITVWTAAAAVLVPAGIWLMNS
ncbi:MAG: DMT family transporter [Bryobacteraceae bacterium]|nr:DMT family transporter [Bryobacteraceae bacterium]